MTASRKLFFFFAVLPAPTIFALLILLLLALPLLLRVSDANKFGLLLAQAHAPEGSVSGVEAVESGAWEV